MKVHENDDGENGGREEFGIQAKFGIIIRPGR